MPKPRHFNGGDSQGDGQKSSDPSAKKKPLDVLRRQAVENQGVKSKKRALAVVGGDVGSGESEKFEDKNMQNPDNAQTVNTTKKVYKRQYSTGKKSRRKQKNQKKTSKKGKLKETVKSELEEVIESTRFDGKKEKIHQMYEIIEKSSKGRFKRVKHLIDGEYKIEVIDDSTQKMTKSAKDIWQSAVRGEKEQQIQGLVPKLDSFHLNHSNWGY